jgi:hypothetical protein
VHSYDLPQSAPILLSFDVRGENGIVHLLGSPRIGPINSIAFVASDAVLRNCSISSPPWVPKETIGIARHPGGTIHLLTTDESGFVLHRLDPSGTPLDTQLVRPDGMFTEEWHQVEIREPVPLCAREAAVYLGVGRGLVRMTSNRLTRIDECATRIRSICGSAPFSVGRVVAILERGAALHWENDKSLTRFADELTAPVGCFTASGWIVLASASELHVYRTEGRKLILAARTSCHGEPVAALATEQPDGFGILRADGRVEVYQMPRR